MSFVMKTKKAHYNGNFCETNTLKTKTKKMINFRNKAVSCSVCNWMIIFHFKNPSKFRYRKDDNKNANRNRFSRPLMEALISPGTVFCKGNPIVSQVV